MRTKNWLGRVLVVSLLSSAALAQSSDKVDDYVQGVMKERKIPGIALLVVQDNKVVLSKGYGFSNVELQVPVKPETVFQSGSMGKQFTATAVMMLVEEGKVGLEDPLTKYFPEAPAAWKNVTVRQLLSHTGGFTDYPEKFDFRRDRTENEILKAIEAVPLAYPPGTKWAYSNLGYATLGILIHRASGKFYGDFLQERVFGPLGMSTTRIISEEDIIPNRAAGYRVVKGQLKNQEWVSPTLNTTADGSLYFSILDLEKWDAALTQGKLLKKSSFDEMWTIAEAQRRQAKLGGLRFRMVSAEYSRSSDHRARRRVAGIQHEHQPLCEGQVDRGRPDQPRRMRSGRHRTPRGRFVRFRVDAGPREKIDGGQRLRRRAKL